MNHIMNSNTIKATDTLSQYIKITITCLVVTALSGCLHDGDNDKNQESSTSLSDCFFNGGGGNNRESSNILSDCFFNGGYITYINAVSTVDPAAGAIDVEPGTTISATFNQDMFETTISDTSFTLRDSDNTPVSGTVSYDAINLTATLTPTRNLGLLRTYSSRLSSDITNLEGSPMYAVNWSFTTRDGAWNTAEKIETDNAAGAFPQVAFDTDGNAVAVWINDTNDVYANSYTASTGSWGLTATQIGTSPSQITGLRVAMDASGNAIAVWSEAQGGTNNIRAAHYDGTNWATDVGLESNSGDAQFPQIAMDGAGNALVVWLQPDTVNSINSIWYNAYDATSGTWGTADLLETTDNVADAPQVAMDESGNAIAVWLQDDGLGTTNVIYAMDYAPGVGWNAGGPTPVSTNTGYTPQIAIDSSGNAIAVWYQVTGTVPTTTYGLYANQYSSGSWSTAALVEDSVNNTVNPQIALDDQSNGIAVWRSSTNRIRYRFYNASWGTAGDVDSGGSAASLPQLAVDSEGHAIVVWRQLSNGAPSIWSNRYQFGNGWGTPELLETDDTYQILFPEVGMDSLGNAFAIWIQSDGASNSTWVSRFD